MEFKEPKQIDPAKIELRPDGWERFRSYVHAVAKSGPKHRPPKAEPSIIIEKERKPSLIGLL
jgi:hypothetical protein